MQGNNVQIRKKKILLIDVNCKNSSTGQIVYDLYRTIGDEGMESAVCYGRGAEVKEPNIFKFGLDWETYLHAALARITGYNGCFSFFSTRRLIRFIDAFKPDLVHIHELHAYFVNLRPLIEYLKQKNIPVVWTFHCEYMYTGKCGHAFECREFLNACGNCPKLNEYPKSLFLDRTKQMLAMKQKLLADWNFTIAVPSQWLAGRIGMTFLKNKPVTTVYNGINTSVFCPRERNFFADEPYQNKHILLGVADYWTDSKGKDDFYRLAKSLGKDYVCVLVGTQVEKEEEIPSNIVYYGRINNKQDLARAYSSADVFVHLSKLETFGLVIAEAACCGTPVVGWNATGVQEVLAMTGGCGVGVEEGVEGVARAIRHICSSTHEARSPATSDELREKFSNQKMLFSYMELYRKLLLSK